MIGLVIGVLSIVAVIAALVWASVQSVSVESDSAYERAEEMEL